MNIPMLMRGVPFARLRPGEIVFGVSLEAFGAVQSGVFNPDRRAF